MKKRKLDYHVNSELEQFLTQARELGLEPTQDIINEYRQTLEGKVAVEFWKCEGKITTPYNLMTKQIRPSEE